MVLWCYDEHGGNMAYFLKKSTNKKGLYLQIYESFYDPARRQTAHRSVEALGYEHELRQAGIADPVAHFKAKVDSMNAERRARKIEGRARRVGGSTPERMLGHFPFKALDARLGALGDLRYLQLAGGLRFSVSDLLSELVYARLCAPCSKRRTFHDVLPSMFGSEGFSLDQLYDGMGFLGAEYPKVIEAYNHAIADAWPRETSRTYFDCTNFYFEIDREDELRRKGPSRERRADPIVGMGLLLDADCVPLGMRIYPGNESEKPVLRRAIDEMRRRAGVTGKVVRVADKGLNCADNVADAVLSGDGYIFSKSVKQLPRAELAWVLSDEGWVDVAGVDGQARYSYKKVVGDFEYKVSSENGKKRAVALPEKRVATYSPKLAKKQLAEINRQIEKARSLRLAAAKKSEYGDSARYVTFTAVDADGEVPDGMQVACSLNREAIERARSLAGYSMIVTSEVNMPASEIYDAYHNLWRIEESFRVMKSQLDARPVYLQKPNSIKGHFLVCYIAVLLLRLLQVKVLGNRYSSEEIVAFARGFRVVEASPRKYVNLSRSSSLLDELERLSGQPLGNYYLKKSEVDAILNTKLDFEATQDGVS